MNIYDFDKTIYDGDSSIDFFKFCIKKNKKIILDLIPICFSAILYLLKLKDKEYFKSSFFRFFKRINVDEYVKYFWQENKSKIKDFYLKQHKKTDIIISASPEILLKPLEKKYEISVIATIVDKKTGKLIGKNCYGQEKLIRLKEKNITKCNEFYSDSLSDTPCAKLAKKAFLVKGNVITKWEKI